jgi:SAM-dependent methyltransferase
MKNKELLQSQAELIQYIKVKKKPPRVGSATSDGFVYHEIPFSGYEDLDFHRKDSATRIALIEKHVPLKGLKILDIGCNSGYFSFELARLGAKQCVGVDYDEDAIFIADSLKVIHNIKNVDFLNIKFSDDFPETITQKFGTFDVIMLNSIIHWLVYANYSLDKVINLLNRLDNGGKQIIIYEPSSSGSAYYPELLEELQIKRFFTDLGAFSYQKIGTSFAANVDDNRDMWMGEKNITQTAIEIATFLEKNPNVAVGDRLKNYSVAHINRDKICFLGAQFFIKTTISCDSMFKIFLENEYKRALILNNRSFATPVLVGNVTVSGRYFLFYKPIEHICIEDVFIKKADIQWISKELYQFLDTLKWCRLVHNDLRPQNILIDKKNKSVKIIDYEWCGTGSSIVASDHSETWFPFTCKTDQETELVTKLLPFLCGKKYRSPFGFGHFEHDLFAINKIIFQLKNRKTYRRNWVSNLKAWVKIKSIIRWGLGHIFFVTKYRS